MFKRRKRGKFTILFVTILLGYWIKLGLDMNVPGSVFVATLGLVIYWLQSYWLYRRNRDRE